MFREDALASGRYRRAPRRWQTQFGQWISDVGVSRIVATLAPDPDLRITNQTVYEWLQGHPPHPSRAIALVAMSDGRLTLDAIYQHSREVKQLTSSGASENGPKNGIRR